MSQLEEIAELLEQAARASKCAPCGCAHGAVAAIEAAVGTPGGVRSAAAELAAGLRPQEYDCLGCPACWPAEALGLLGDAGLVDTTPACPTEPVSARAGWPPLSGTYRVLRWSAPVAVCTLGDPSLAEAVAEAAGPELAIVGTLATENLGIERLVANVVANPNVRFLVLAGGEPRQAVGHLPGASLLALAANGTDASGRIIAAPGRRPVLRNIAADDIARFRSVVEMVDLIGLDDPGAIHDAARACAGRSPGSAAPPAMAAGRLSATPGRLPTRMTPDPNGYFVVLPDRARRILVLEHYTNDGLLDAVIEGATPAHCYTAAIDSGLLGRLDHAAYLGRELARAEAALAAASAYVQDAAAEHPGCDGDGAGPSC